jgi:Leucine-rich repeat (LRR) protein
VITSSVSSTEEVITRRQYAPRRRVRGQTAVLVPTASTVTASTASTASTVTAPEPDYLLPSFAHEALKILRESREDKTPQQWEKHNDFVLYLARHYRLSTSPLSAADLTPGLRKKLVAIFVLQIIQEKGIDLQQELGPNPNDSKALYYDGLLLRNASGKPISMVVADLEKRVQQVLTQHGLGGIPGLCQQVLPLLTVDPTVSLLPRANIAYGGAQWITLWTGINCLTEQGIDPAQYTEVDLMDIGRASLIAQHSTKTGAAKEFMATGVGMGGLLLMAHTAGYLDVRTLNSNDKKAIHNQLMAFVKATFAEDLQIIEALTTLAHTPCPTRRQLAGENLWAAALPTTKSTVDTYMEMSALADADLVTTIPRGVIKTAWYYPLVGDQSRLPVPLAVQQAREKLYTQSLKAEFESKFDQYVQCVSAQIAKIVEASLSRYGRRHGIDLSTASITVSQTQREIYEQGSGVSHGGTIPVVGSTAHTYTPLDKTDSQGYFICIDTSAGKHQYFFSLTQAREFELPAGKAIEDWSKENVMLVFGIEPEFEHHPAQKIVRRYSDHELASGKTSEIANRIKVVLPATLKPLRNHAYEKLLADKVVEGLENTLIPFRSTYLAIRDGEDIKTILLDAGLDVLIFLPAIGEGLSLSLRVGEVAAAVMVEELETLSEKGIFQAIKRSSASLLSQLPSLTEQAEKVLHVALQNAMWLPHDILSLVRGGRRWTTKGMAALIQALKKSRPKLAQQLSETLNSSVNRISADGGKLWKLSNATVDEVSATAIQTPYVKATAAGSEARLLQRVDTNSYTEFNPQTGAQEGPRLVADAQGNLRRLALADAVAAFQIKNPNVLQQLSFLAADENHLLSLGNKHYAPVEGSYLEVVPNQVAQAASATWRIHDPMRMGASADYSLPSIAWHESTDTWYQVEVPRVNGGGRELSPAAAAPVERAPLAQEEDFSLSKTAFGDFPLGEMSFSEEKYHDIWADWAKHAVAGEDRQSAVWNMKDALKNKKNILDLSGLHLSGLPSHLPPCKILDLSHNKFTREALKNLPEDLDLKYLDLSYNRITYDQYSYNPLFSAKLKTLEVLNLSNNNIKNFFLERNFKNLKKLDLSNSNVVNFASSLEAKKLEELNLSANHLTTFSGGVELNKLKRINLSFNNLDKIFLSESSLDLRELCLNNNRLTEFDMSLPLENLEILNLHANDIQEFYLPSTSKKLRELSLDNNKLTEFDVSSPLENLEKLSLERNSIQRISLPATSKKLRVLSVNNNYLTEFDVLSSLENLENLNLHDNQILKFSLSSKSQKLRELYLNNNQLTKFKVSSPLENLEILSLQRNNIQSISLPGTAKKLKVLSANNNKIMKFDVSSPLEDLESLNLHGNYIQQFSLPATSKKLRELYLDNNYLAEFKVSSPLENLEILKLHNNGIQKFSLPATSKKLRMLSVNNNQLAEFSVASSLENLEMLSLQHNNIKKISLPETSKKLKVLFLHNNILTKFKVSSSLENLERLNLSSNHLEEVDLPSTATNLMEMNVSVNKLRSIAKLFHANEALFKKLKLLDLSYNKLRIYNKYPEELASLPAACCVLTFEGNHL